MEGGEGAGTSRGQEPAPNGGNPLQQLLLLTAAHSGPSMVLPAGPGTAGTLSMQQQQQHHGQAQQQQQHLMQALSAQPQLMQVLAAQPQLLQALSAYLHMQAPQQLIHVPAHQQQHHVQAQQQLIHVQAQQQQHHVQAQQQQQHHVQAHQQQHHMQAQQQQHHGQALQQQIYVQAPQQQIHIQAHQQQHHVQAHQQQHHVQAHQQQHHVQAPQPQIHIIQGPQGPQILLTHEQALQLREQLGLLPSGLVISTPTLNPTGPSHTLAPLRTLDLQHDARATASGPSPQPPQPMQPMQPPQPMQPAQPMQPMQLALPPIRPAPAPPVVRLVARPASSMGATASHSSMDNASPLARLTHLHDTAGQGSTQSPLAGRPRPQGSSASTGGRVVKPRKRTRPTHHLFEAEGKCSALDQQVQQLEEEHQRLHSRDQLLQLAVRCRDSQLAHMQLLGFIPLSQPGAAGAAGPSVILPAVLLAAPQEQEEGEAPAPAPPPPPPPAPPTLEQVQRLRVLNAAAQEAFGGLRELQVASAPHLEALLLRAARGRVPPQPHQPRASQPSGTAGACRPAGPPISPTLQAMVALCRSGGPDAIALGGEGGTAALLLPSVSSLSLHHSTSSAGPSFMVPAPSTAPSTGAASIVGVSLPQVLARGSSGDGDAPRAGVNLAGSQLAGVHPASQPCGSSSALVAGLLGGLSATHMSAAGLGDTALPQLGGLSAPQVSLGPGMEPVDLGSSTAITSNTPATKVEAGDDDGEDNAKDGFSNSKLLAALATCLPLLFLCNPAAVPLMGRRLPSVGQLAAGSQLPAGGAPETADAPAPDSHWMHVLGQLNLSPGQLQLLCDLQRLLQSCLLKQEVLHHHWAGGLRRLLRLEMSRKAQGFKVQLGGPYLRQGELMEASQKLLSGDHNLVLLVVDMVATGILTHEQVMLVLSASWPFFPNFLALCDAAATAVEASQAQQQQQQQQLLSMQQAQQADMLPIMQLPPQTLPSQQQQSRLQRVQQQQPQQQLQQQPSVQSLPRTAQGPTQGS